MERRTSAGRGSRALGVSLLAAGLAAVWASGGRAAEGVATTRVSVSSSGVEGNASSNPLSSISADGRFVAFTSAADNLVPGDTNEIRDVFVRDLQQQTTTRVSVSTAGLQAESDNASLVGYDNTVYGPSISADGRFVAFTSQGSFLVPGDTNGTYDVFVRDLVQQTTTRVSVSTDGLQGDSLSYSPSISADGRFVAFTSHAANLAPNDREHVQDVFVRDLVRQTTTLVSVSLAGTSGAAGGNGLSKRPSISADGRFVAFCSGSNALVPGDANDKDDIFVRDVQGQTTTRVSVSTGGAQAEYESDWPSISADGRFVAFQSVASNLVPGDTNGDWDIFVRDVQDQTTARVSLSNGGSQADTPSFHPSITADGRFVAFQSPAPNLVPGDTNGDWDIFVRDLPQQTTTRVNLSSSGTQALGGASDWPAISARGQFVAATSGAANLVPGDTNNTYDIFVFDLGPQASIGVTSPNGGEEWSIGSSPTIRWTSEGVGTQVKLELSRDGGSTWEELAASAPNTGSFAWTVTGPPTTQARVRVTSLDSPSRADSSDGDFSLLDASLGAMRVAHSSTGDSYYPSTTWDGRYVAFVSWATNLVPGDTNGVGDIFVRDMQTNTFTRVSVSTGNVQTDAYSEAPAISADGRYVAFVSAATNLVPDDTNGVPDVFVRDLQANTTTRVSVADSGEQADGASYTCSISAWFGPCVVAFESDATNLVPGDTNQVRDVFVRYVQAGGTRRASVASDGTQSEGHSVAPRISPDGRFVAFTSRATNLVPGDTNGAWDAFVRDLWTGFTTRVSVSSDGAQGNGSSWGTAINWDGRFVAFFSEATNLVPGGSQPGIFLWDRDTGTTTRVDLTSAGPQGDIGGYQLSLSADGRFLAFSTVAASLVPGDTGGYSSVFVRDRLRGVTHLASVSLSGAPGNSNSWAPSISGDGRFVDFHSYASDLVPGDTNGKVDVFRYTIPSIRVTSPNGGENWVPGTVQTIRWTSANAGSKVRISLYRKGRWETLAAAAPIDAPFQWLVTGPEDVQAWVAVTAENAWDDSDGTVSIAAVPPRPAIRVFAPNGGEQWLMDTHQQIRWGSVNAGTRVKVELSRNGGLFWEELAASAPNTGSFAWTPSGPPTAQAGVRVTSLDNPSVSDSSNRSFTVTRPPTLEDPSVIPANLPYWGGRVQFFVAASDDFGISSVTAEVLAADGTSQSIPLGGFFSTPTGGIYRGFFDAPPNESITPQRYQVVFRAVDAAGGKGMAHSAPWITVAALPDAGLPWLRPANLSDYGIVPQRVPWTGGKVTLTVTAGDDFQVTSVRAVVEHFLDARHDPPDTVALSLISGDDRSGVYQGTYQVKPNMGTTEEFYTVTFVARDRSGQETRLRITPASGGINVGIRR